MGKYGIIFIADGDGNPVALWHLSTSLGRVVMIFSDMDDLAEVLPYAERHVTEPGDQLALMQFTAESPAEVVEMWAKSSPDSIAGLHFVASGDELFDDLLAQLRSRNAASS